MGGLREEVVSSAMPYKVMYHVGPDISLKTKVNEGILTIRDGAVSIEGKAPFDLPLENITSVELFRLHGLGRMIKVCCGEQNLFVSVIRFNFFGYFALINFFGTGRLRDELSKVVEPR